MLQDYELLFRANSRAGVATIEPRKGSSVPIGIWAISNSDEAELDHYEGWPYLYAKQVLSVKVKGRKVRAMVYVMTPGHQIAPPSAYYLRVIAEGYADFGFDTKPLLDAAARAKGAEE